MLSVFNRFSDRSVERIALAAFLIAVLGLAGLVGLYRWERQAEPKESVLDRQARQLEDKVRENPNDAAVRLNVAGTYLQRGDYGEAIEQFQQVLVLDKENEGALIGLAMTHMEKGSKSEAINYFNQVLDLNKDSEFAHVDKRLAAIHFYIGKIRLRSNELDEAERELTLASSIDVTSSDILVLLGTVYQKQGKHVEAVDTFNKSLRFDPTFLDAYQGLAASYKATGNSNKAAFAEAMIALSSGQMDSAIGKLLDVVTKTPDADAYWGLGWAYEKKGQKENALVAYQQAVNVNPQQSLAATGLNRLKNAR